MFKKCEIADFEESTSSKTAVFATFWALNLQKKIDFTKYFQDVTENFEIFQNPTEIDVNDVAQDEDDLAYLNFPPSGKSKKGLKIVSATASVSAATTADSTPRFCCCHSLNLISL